MKYFFVIFCISIACCTLLSSSALDGGTINGTIVDENDVPLILAKVTAMPMEKGATGSRAAAISSCRGFYLSAAQAFLYGRSFPLDSQFDRNRAHFSRHPGISSVRMKFSPRRINEISLQLILAARNYRRLRISCFVVLCRRGYRTCRR